jgi:hypothetical protein
MTSSTVMTPTSLFSSSTTGIARQVVGCDLPRDLFLVHVGRDADEIGRHDPLQRRVGSDEQQAAAASTTPTRWRRTSITSE